MIEKPEDMAKDAKGKWKLWQREIENAQEYRKAFDKEVAIYNDIYRNEAEGTQYAGRRYPIFWANVQTLKPLVFSNLPLADIRRRYAAKDAVARLSSILLERCTNYFMEKGELDVRLEHCRDDALITGWGIIKVKFENEIVQTESFGEQSAGKRIEYDFVPYKDYLCSPAKIESMVRWRAYRHKMNREELEEHFGEKAKNVTMTESIMTSEIKNDKEGENEIFKRAEVWEIWDKTSGKVIFWSQGYSLGLLSEEDDAYNLESFFPSPAPVNMGRVNNSILPVPPYRMYKAQAEELNEISERIESITKQIKAGGLYAKVLSAKDVADLLNNDDGEYSPADIPPDTDINKLVYNKDVVALANVLQVLRAQKQEVINEIRDITGLSDIVRGTSVASETATAQKLKGNFAISRIQTQQEAMTKFIRNIIRITGELIAEHFTGEELAQIANMRILKQAEFNQKVNAIIISQNLNPEEAQKVKLIMQEEQDKTIKIEMAVTDEMLAAVEKVLRDDKLRGYSIDIESETTVQVDADKLKAQRLEFINVMSAFIQQYAPMVQAGFLTRESFVAMLGFVARPFKVGRELEESFEMMGETPEEQQNKAPDPAIIDAQLRSRDLDIKELKVQSDFAINTKKVQIDAAKLDVTQSENEHDREANFQRDEFKHMAEVAKFSKQAQEAIQ